MPAMYPEDVGFARNRHPDKNIGITNNHYTSVNQQFGGGYERRILRTRRTKRKYTLRYTKVESDVKEKIEIFYSDRNGDFESFTLNLSHIHETGTVLVRFEGGLNITLIDTVGATNYYDVSFTLVEVHS